MAVVDGAACTWVGVDEGPIELAWLEEAGEVAPYEFLRFSGGGGVGRVFWSSRLLDQHVLLCDIP